MIHEKEERHKQFEKSKLAKHVIKTNWIIFDMKTNCCNKFALIIFNRNQAIKMPLDKK